MVAAGHTMYTCTLALTLWGCPSPGPISLDLLRRALDITIGSLGLRTLGMNSSTWVYPPLEGGAAGGLTVVQPLGSSFVALELWPQDTGPDLLYLSLVSCLPFDLDALVAPLEHHDIGLQVHDSTSAQVCGPALKDISTSSTSCPDHLGVPTEGERMGEEGGPLRNPITPSCSTPPQNSLPSPSVTNINPPGDFNPPSSLTTVFSDPEES